MGTLSNEFGASAVSFGASGDGLVVSGQNSSPNFGDQDFRWTSLTGMVGIGYLPGGTFSRGGYISRDGNVIVGWGNSTNGISEAFRWTSSTGMVGLGDFPGRPVGQFTSSAKAVSADGSVIAGAGTLANGNGSLGRWTSATGWVPLGTLPGSSSTFGGIFGISGDGNYIIGQVNDSTLQRSVGFRWTLAQGMVSLGEYTPGFIAQPHALTDDGQFIVGNTWSGTDNMAFIWDQAHGLRNLQSVLQTDYALSIPTGWLLTDAYGISGDPTTTWYIAGNGVNPQGKIVPWLVTVVAVPEPITWALIGIGIVAAVICYVRQIKSCRKQLEQEVEYTL